MVLPLKRRKSRSPPGPPLPPLSFQHASGRRLHGAGTSPHLARYPPFDCLNRMVRATRAAAPSNGDWPLALQDQRTTVPSLVTLDRPGGPIWRNREDHVLSQLSPEELPLWHAERNRAEEEGLLVSPRCAAGFPSRADPRTILGAAHRRQSRPADRCAMRSDDRRSKCAAKNGRAASPRPGRLPPATNKGRAGVR